MENAHVISITGIDRTPGADAGTWERFKAWANEVYLPINANIPGVKEAAAYNIIKDTPEYPEFLGFGHYMNLKSRLAYAASSGGNDIVKEFKSWTDRGITEQIWSSVYGLIKSFRSKPVFPDANGYTTIENPNVVHFEAFRLSPEEQEKYYKWFNDYCTIFMPLFMKIPGIVGYDWYEYTGLCRKQDVREQDYPRYLSVIYFEKPDSFESYAKSPELSGFQKVMRSVFPQGLKYEWYVQYRLLKSVRK